MAIPPGIWCYRVSTGTGWPGVSIPWLGKKESLICNFYVSVAACNIQQICPWDTQACCWDIKQPTNKLCGTEQSNNNIFSGFFFFFHCCWNPNLRIYVFKDTILPSPLLPNERRDRKNPLKYHFKKRAKTKCFAIYHFHNLISSLSISKPQQWPLWNSYAIKNCNPLLLTFLSLILSSLWDGGGLLGVRCSHSDDTMVGIMKESSWINK